MRVAMMIALAILALAFSAAVGRADRMWLAGWGPAAVLLALMVAVLWAVGAA